MKTYTIIGGVNGAGKSSLTGVLKAETRDLGKIIDVDKLNIEHGGTLAGGRAAVKLIRECIERGVTVDESIKRIANRVEKGGHNIPEIDVVRRFNSRYEDIASVLPYCNEAVFYDNENGFKAVAEYRNGELQILGSSMPDWLYELTQYLEGK